MFSYKSKIINSNIIPIATDANGYTALNLIIASYQSQNQLRAVYNVYMIDKKKLQNILVFLFFLFLPTQLGRHFFFDFSYLSGVRIDYLAPTIYLTDIIVIFLAVLNYKVLFEFGKKHARLILCFGVLALLNIFFAQSAPLGFYKSLKYIEMFIVFVIIRKTDIPVKNVLLALVIGAVTELPLSSLQVVNKQSIQGVFYLLGERFFSLSTPGIAKVSLRGVEVLRAYGTFSHPNSLAGFYLLIYAFTLVYKPFEQFALFKAILLGCCAFLIFISFSKIAIVTLLLFTIAYFFIIQKEIHCKLCIFSRIFGLLLLAFIFISAKGDPLSFEKRWILNENALSIILQHPLFGVGFGNYLLAQAQFPIKYAYYFLQPVHNIFLLFISEAGVILTGFLLYITYKNVPWKKLPLKTWFILAIIVIAGMFDHYWLTLQQNMLLLPAVFALLSKEKEA